MEHRNASTDFDAEMDLIELVNDLQTKLAASGSSLDISLPQIVVVGCQSAGKSSVLENFVGREFLPRGTGTVTRRPTIVQLIPSVSEYAVFPHKPDLVFNDFEKVKEEIQAETMRDPGPDLFSDKPITLKIFSPNVLKLSLVDLPGLIQVAVGRQTQRDIDQVREMILNYIRQPESLILAVSPANNDIANSEALKIAKEVDPQRERTIGVLTKLDLMDAGTDARAILENQIIPLRRGYVGVVNRGQKDIEDKKDIEYIRKKEKAFIAESPGYSHMASRMGTTYLQKLLHKQLRAHIQAALPRVRNELTEKLNVYRKQLNELNAMMGEGANGKRLYMLKLIQKFVDDMEMKLMGQSELVEKKSISAGAIINQKLYTEVQNNLDLELHPDEEEVTIIIVNIAGIRNSISIPSLTLEAACRSLLEQYKAPLQHSVDCVTDVLRAAITKSAEVVNQYPTLKYALEYGLNTFVDQAAENTKNLLMSHIEAEMFYVNIGHADFNSSVCDPVAPTAGPVMIWGEPSEGSSNESASSLVARLKSNTGNQQKVNYITAILTKYLEIVRKQIGDVVIKYILFFLVKRVLDYMKSELMLSLLGSSNINTLMQDCDEEYRRQEELEIICRSLKEALDAIKTF